MWGDARVILASGKPRERRDTQGTVVKIYLDTCSLQRPLDSKTHIRTVLEADAVLGIIDLCESGKVRLVSSEVLTFETERTPSPIRRQYARQVLAMAKVSVEVTNQVSERATEFLEFGLKPLDALHLACAEQGQADYLCTCDDRFLRNARAIPSMKTTIISPIELIKELE
jgi:predicted nucleic acid-binding protein